MKTLILGNFTFEENSYKEIFNDDFKLITDILEFKNIANEIDEISPEAIVFDFPTYDKTTIEVLAKVKKQYEDIKFIFIGNKKEYSDIGKEIKGEFFFIDRKHTTSPQDILDCIDIKEEEWKVDWFAVSADTKKHWKLYLFLAILAIALMAYITYYPFNQ